MPRRKNNSIFSQQISVSSLGNKIDFKPQPEEEVVLDGVRKKVFLDRYALKDKEGELLEHTPLEMWKRVAWGIAQSEKEQERKFWEDKFYDVMKGFKFIPGGRILSGAGTGFQVTYFNCFVIPSPKDSRDGILDSLKQLVEIQSRSGGVGLNLSSLRPRGARVKKVNGFSSGPITWAGLFSYATHDVVQQGGSRRGATMLMLWDWHPDIEEFITVKQDLSKINGANLSVCVSDKLMEAIKNDSDWDLVYPDLDDPEYDEKWDGELDNWKALGKKIKVYKTVKARDLWNLICEAAWRSAEPGLHFLDRSNKRSNTYYFEKLAATNPSLRAGTKVLTKQGIFPIEKLEGKSFYVKNLDGQWSKAKCFLSGKNKPLYKLTLSSGKEIYATKEHKWPVLLVGGGFGKVTTNQLKPGNILPYPKSQNINFETENMLLRDEGFMIGWLYGDGWISTEGSRVRQFSSTQTEPLSPSRRYYHQLVSEGILTSNQETYLNFTTPIPDEIPLHTSRLSAEEKVFGFCFSEEDKPLSERILKQVNRFNKVASNVQKSGNSAYVIQVTSHEFASNLSTVFGVTKKEDGLPVSVWQSGDEFLKGFIDGLFSSDGFVTKTGNRIILTTKHKRIAEDVADLMSFFGIKSTIRFTTSENPRFPNGERYYKTFERYDVSIDGYVNVSNFGKIFSLSDPIKQANLEKSFNYKPSRKTADEELTRVVSVERTDLKENVWDISVYDDTHCFYINHCITGNCGEQPLGPWAVCNLGAMNLSAYVKNGEFDYQSFGDDVKVAMRFLDNVIDQTYYFFPENEQCAKDIRRTGLGIMGLADALIKMKIKYGSEESLPIIEKIFKTLRDNAYDASSDIAVEKGTFPKFDKEKYLEGYHIENLPEDLREKIGRQGIRNAVLLTIAPTGTTSTLAGASSGVEPVYEFSYKMRWRDEGNRGWREDEVYHPLYQEWKNAHPDEEKPDYFASANDLTPLEHVKVQAVAQKYIDSSISKTVNAPNSHTVDDVKTLYMAAYDMGLKGITYMRDGSREGVLSRIEEKPEEKKEEAVVSVKRPMVLHGRTYKVMTPLGEAFITINRDEKNEPMELFATIGKAGMHVGADAEAIGRLASLALRSNPTNRREIAQKIVAQLKDIGASSHIGFGKDRVMSLADAIAKVLAEDLAYADNMNSVETLPLDLNEGNGSNGHATQQQMAILDYQQIAGKQTDLCPECGNASLVHEEGCKKCYNCGYSAC